MGVDVRILVRHNFYELNDFEKSMEFVKQSINKVKSNLCINADYEYFELYGYFDDENNFSMIEFKIPLLDLSIELRRGYWSIWSGWHHCQVTNKINGRLHIVDKAFDIVRAMGGNEAWLCDEFIDDEYYENTIKELLVGVAKSCGIFEYPYSELIQYDDNEFPAPKECYHYAFDELLEEFNALAHHCGEYKPTIITPVGDGYTRVVRDGMINLVDSCGQLIFNMDFDDIQKIVGKEFICRRGDKIALFGAGLKQLSDFVEGEFEWAHTEGMLADKERICYKNHKAKIRILAIYHEDGQLEYNSISYKSRIVKRKPFKCQACKGRVVPIMYGEPTPEAGAQAARGEIVLGGCVVHPYSSQWICVNCHTEYIRDKEYFII